MNLLLILSALMTALTGAFTGARAPQVHVAQVAGQRTQAIRQAAAPARAWLALARAPAAPAAIATRLLRIAGTPIYMAKRRE